MRSNAARNLFPTQLAVLALASAIAIPAAHAGAVRIPDSQNTPPSTTQQQPSPTAKPLNNSSKEGFWGRINPMARKKWVKRQTDPINDRLSELDEVNAKNAKDIQDVDARAQAGIKQAQSTADQANQTATAAGTQAQNANQIASTASGRVDQLHTTVSGIDAYKPINELDVPFKRGSSMLVGRRQGAARPACGQPEGSQGIRGRNRSSLSCPWGGRSSELGTAGRSGQALPG